MNERTHHELDQQLTNALDQVGVVGSLFRTSLLRDLKAKVVFRDAQDAVELVGLPGTGRHQAAKAAHAAAADLLNRRGPLIDLDCGAAETDPRSFRHALNNAVQAAEGGTLILDRYMVLDQERRGIAGRTLNKVGGRVLGLALSVEGSVPAGAGYRPSTRIQIKPLHEREEDIWELTDHFFLGAASDCGAEGCRGFSRQAKADIAQVVRETNLASVRQLRNIVRDVVFEAYAEGPLPLKLVSDHVRPYLERTFDQTDRDRQARETALVASQFDAAVDATMLSKLAEIHQVPEELLLRQVAILRDAVAHIDDAPPSYRNIMVRSDNLKRAALWLLTGANSQAEFRRYFGTERFMQPTKSVAWAFYNCVFKRDS